VGEAGHDGPLGGLDGLFFRLGSESRAVVGEDHVPGQVPQPKAQDIVAVNRLGHDSVEVPDLAGIELPTERSTVEKRIHGGLGDEQGFGPTLGQPPLACLGP